MEKSLLVEKKNAYGVLHVYPRCEKSKIFAEMTGKKTLTYQTISLCKKLGYEFKHVENSI